MSMELSNYLVSWVETYLGDLQPTYIGVIICLLSSMDIPVWTFINFDDSLPTHSSTKMLWEETLRGPLNVDVGYPMSLGPNRPPIGSVAVGESCLSTKDDEDTSEYGPLPQTTPNKKTLKTYNRQLVFHYTYIPSPTRVAGACAIYSETSQRLIGPSDGGFWLCLSHGCLVGSQRQSDLRSRLTPLGEACLVPSSLRKKNSLDRLKQRSHSEKHVIIFCM